MEQNKIKDIFTNAMGQYLFPGQGTVIENRKISPGVDITTKNVNSPMVVLTPYGAVKTVPNQTYSMAGNTALELPMAKAGGSQTQLLQIIQMYAQMKQLDPNDIVAELQSLPKEQQQKSVELMATEVQQAMMMQQQQQMAQQQNAAQMQQMQDMTMMGQPADAAEEEVDEQLPPMARYGGGCIDCMEAFPQANTYPKSWAGYSGNQYAQGGEPSPQAQNLNWFYENALRRYMAIGGPLRKAQDEGQLESQYYFDGRKTPSMLQQGVPVINNRGNITYVDDEGYIVEEMPRERTMEELDRIVREQFMMNQDAKLMNIPGMDSPSGDPYRGRMYEYLFENPNQPTNTERIKRTTMMVEGGRSEAFPQAQTYLPYDRPGETRPNFMFAKGGQNEYGGQPSLETIYKKMKAGGLAVNPQKKKSGSLTFDDFQQYLRNGGLKHYQGPDQSQTATSTGTTTNTGTDRLPGESDDEYFMRTNNQIPGPNGFSTNVGTTNTGTTVIPATGGSSTSGTNPPDTTTPSTTTGTSVLAGAKTVDPATTSTTGSLPTITQSPYATNISGSLNNNASQNITVDQGGGRSTRNSDGSITSTNPDGSLTTFKNDKEYERFLNRKKRGPSDPSKMYNNQFNSDMYNQDRPGGLAGMNVARWQRNMMDAINPKHTGLSGFMNMIGNVGKVADVFNPWSKNLQKWRGEYDYSGDIEKMQERQERRAQRKLNRIGDMTDSDSSTESSTPYTKPDDNQHYKVETYPTADEMNSGEMMNFGRGGNKKRLLRYQGIAGANNSFSGNVASSSYGINPYAMQQPVITAEQALGQQNNVQMDPEQKSVQVVGEPEPSPNSPMESGSGSFGSGLSDVGSAISSYMSMRKALKDKQPDPNAKKIDQMLVNQQQNSAWAQGKVTAASEVGDWAKTQNQLQIMKNFKDPNVTGGLGSSAYMPETQRTADSAGNYTFNEGIYNPKSRTAAQSGRFMVDQNNNFFTNFNEYNDKNIFGRSARNGGSILNMFKDGGVYDLDEATIRRIIAEGGSVEYI